MATEIGRAHGHFVITLKYPSRKRTDQSSDVERHALYVIKDLIGREDGRDQSCLCNKEQQTGKE